MIINLTEPYRRASEVWQKFIGNHNKLKMKVKSTKTSVSFTIVFNTKLKKMSCTFNKFISMP